MSNKKNSITLPPGHKKLSAMPVDKDALNFAREQLQTVSPGMEKFFNEVGSQNGAPKKKRKSIKKSNEEYASYLISVSRTDLQDIDDILKCLPKFPGRNRPDFSKEDFQRLAIKMLVKKCKEMIKSGKKLNILKR